MKRFLMIIIALTMAVPAFAGRFEVKYISKGQVSVAINERMGGMELLFQILALTGDHSPGPAVVRLDNMPVWRTDGSEYWGSLTIPESGFIKVLEDKDLKILGLSQPNAKNIKVDYRWFLLDHQIEVFFLAVDGKGKVSRNNSAAPATQFSIEEVGPPKAAETKLGEPLTSSQLEAAIRQGYEQGASEGKAAAAQEREQLLVELKKATDELNELRRQVAIRAQPKVMPLGQRYIPFKCNLEQKDWPRFGDEMVLVDSVGRSVAKAKVVESVYGIGRYWVTVTVPVDFEPAGHTLQRPNSRKENK